MDPIYNETPLICTMRSVREFAAQIARVHGAERADAMAQRILSRVEREERKAVEIVQLMYDAQLGSVRERVAFRANKFRTAS